MVNFLSLVKVERRICLVSFSGCAASRALNKEKVKDYSVLEIGTERDLVHSELGIPIIAGTTTNSDLDSLCDVFAFVEGSGGAKYVRAIGYSIMAMGTLGISEIITNPAESTIGDDKIRLRVCYDQNSLIQTVEKLEIGQADHVNERLISHLNLELPT